MDAFWLMVTAAVVFGCAIPITVIWAKHRKDLAQMKVEEARLLAGERVADYAAENGQLQERVKVLERIVTDKGYDVADQIEALRDSPDAGVPLALKKGERV